MALILKYSIYRFRPFSPGDYDLYKRVVALKSSDSDLKVLISYGGYNFGSWTFTQIANSTSARSKFISGALKLIEEYNLDGLDLDWEYPSGVVSLHAALSKKNRGTYPLLPPPNFKYCVSLKKAPFKEHTQTVSSYDYIFLMSYDLHGSWELNTDMHAKLREKSGGGIYNTICDMIKSGGKETTETTAVGAYMSQGTNWHGYDNPASIKIKMEWILKEGYAGAFIWALDTDDFNGKHCGKGTYPLMNAINEGLGGAVLPETTTKTPGQVRKRFKLFERY
ncbi:unnamed protein product [Gongylonema pulchrum]|uniref:Glyco_18 domain-containing protein n=1 Tax=Gongylonema pulchrum TaxID=637853 RepID=A0A183EE01_9BILA|nr:unnamed protein product [Gongylonema pulchrum]